MKHRLPGIVSGIAAVTNKRGKSHKRTYSLKLTAVKISSFLLLSFSNFFVFGSMQ